VGTQAASSRRSREPPRVICRTLMHASLLTFFVILGMVHNPP
jgi:hypothetical protein